VLVAAFVELGRGHSGAPYTWLGAIAGGVYIVAVVVQRVRQ
jgi:presenilin-like A22 family membrane protease